MPAQEGKVYSAAQIVAAIDNMLECHRAGAIDATEGIQRAFLAFEEATCESHADALAFISMSRRLNQSVVCDLVAGREPDHHSVSATDRYMEIAVAFLRLANIRDQVGACGNSVH